MKTSNALWALLTIFVSLGLSLAIGEIYFRDSSYVEPGNALLYRVPHPILGWALEPSASFVNKMPEASVTVAYNNRGWRDVEHVLGNPGNVFRVVLLGDSYMEAYSVDLDNSLSRQLEKVASSENIDIEVINLGVGGYGTLQEYLAYREEGVLYKPDLVLLGFYIRNDVRNNSFELEAILSRRSIKVTSRPFLDSKNTTRWSVSQSDYSSAKKRYAENIKEYNSLLNGLLRESALARSIKIAQENISQLFKVSQLSANVRTEAKLQKEIRKELSLYGVHYCLESPEYMRAWESTSRILERLKQAVESNGSKLMVFSVPAESEVDTLVQKNLQESFQPGPEDSQVCLENAPGYDRLRNILRDNEIEYFNLLPHFRKAMRAEGVNLFRKSDHHWNSEGHALAARLIMPLLRERDFLSGENLQ